MQDLDFKHLLEKVSFPNVLCVLIWYHEFWRDFTNLDTKNLHVFKKANLRRVELIRIAVVIFVWPLAYNWNAMIPYIFVSTHFFSFYDSKKSFYRE
jgi:hypothetical protein